MADQCTPKQSELSEQIGQMVEDAAKMYRGGVENLYLIMKHPHFLGQTYEFWDRLASEQSIRTMLLQRAPFATINVGNFASVDELKKALKNDGFIINEMAHILLDSPPITLLTEKGLLELHITSNAELGYPEGCTIWESFKALEKAGVKKLPPEAAAQLRLQYPGQQPLGEWCLMYMDPIIDLIKDLEVFGIAHYDDAKRLVSIRANRDNLRHGGTIWVYTL